METYFENMTAQEGTKEKLVQDLITLVHDAEDLVKATGENLAEKSKREIMLALNRVKASAGKVEEKAAAQARAADRILREHPYSFVGLAFGLGLVVGLLINRR